MLLRSHVRLPTAVAVVILLSAAAAAVVRRSIGEIPAWVMDEWTFSTQGGGRWVADNAGYKSADEPWDAYGIEWRWGSGRRSVAGRLFGIQRQPGAATRDSAPMWEFLSYWDPARSELVMTQFGSHGAYGIGAARPPANGQAESLQRFYNPDGSTSRTGHRWRRGDRELRQESFSVSESGVWTTRRQYTWTLDSGRPAPSASAETPAGNQVRFTRAGWIGTAVNLEVLPKDLSTRALIDIMKTFTIALDVGCEHCHSGKADDLSSFTFAADTPAKETARTMLTMVRDVNGALSTVGEPAAPGTQKVTCFTCHRGARKPLASPPARGGAER